MDYDDFLDCTIAQVFLFTMSRPSELLKTRRCDGMSSGLLLKYVTESFDEEHNTPMIILKMKSIKTKHLNRLRNTFTYRLQNAQQKNRILEIKEG